jgi:hypothetical protein
LEFVYGADEMRKRSRKIEYDNTGWIADDRDAKPFDEARLPVLPDGYNWQVLDRWPVWRYVVPEDKNKAPQDTEYHRIMWVCCLRGRLAAGLISPDISDSGYWLSKKNEKAEIISLLARRRMQI